MNETTPPHGPQADDSSGEPAGRPDQPRTSDRFFAWLRSLGIVRSSDRWFAGVAGGIAAKAGIDPLIVRGIFVVLAVLGGSGVLLYLVAWLLLPDANGRIHIEDVFRGRASAGVIVAVVILGVLVIVPAIFGILPGLFAGPWAWDVWDVAPGWIGVTFKVIWWALILPALIIWFIVWVSRGGLRGRGPGGPTGPTGPTAPAGAETWAAQAEQSANDRGEDLGRKAEEWGDGFNRKAEDWSRKVEEKSREWERKGTEYYESHKLGAAHVVITLACALLAAGAAAAWMLAQTADVNKVLTAGLIAAVTVLAVSMIVAGIRGRHTGWVGFLAFIGVIALIFAPFTALLPKNTQIVPFGNVTTVVESDGSDQAVLTIAGNSTVDLESLTSRGEARVVELWVLAGNVTVRLPEHHPTRVQVHLLAGNVRDFRPYEGERRQGGIFMSRTIESSTAGVEASDVTQVRIRLLAGNVNVEGGTSSSDRDDDRAGSDEIERLEHEIADLEQRLQDERAAREPTESRLEELRDELENAR